MTDDRRQHDAPEPPDEPEDPDPPEPPEPPWPVPADDEPTADVASSEVGSEVAQAAARGRERRPALSDWEMERQGRQNELDARRDELDLKRKVAPWLFGALGVQITLVNLIFIVYCLVNGFDIDPGVMQVWTGSAVVQVLGLVWIVVRYLFSATAAPDGPGRRSDPS